MLRPTLYVCVFWQCEGSCFARVKAFIMNRIRFLVGCGYFSLHDFRVRTEIGDRSR